MNKTLFAALLAAGASIVSLAPKQAVASDGALDFNGLISDTTCTLHGGDGTDGATKNIGVTLDTVSVAALDTAGKTADDHVFSLILGGAGQTGCADGTKVSLKFSAIEVPAGYASAMVDMATGNLKNTTGAGYATNVQVALLTANGTPINLMTSSGSPEAVVTNNQAQLDYMAHYVATGAATPGDVKTAVMYSLVYN